MRLNSTHTPFHLVADITGVTIKHKCLVSCNKLCARLSTTLLCFVSYDHDPTIPVKPSEIFIMEMR